MQQVRLPDPPPPIIRFELAENRIPDGTGSLAAVGIDAWVLKWFHDPAYPVAYEGDLDNPVVVWDTFGCLFGWGRRAEVHPDGQYYLGAKGYANWFADLQRYEIITMERPLSLGVLEADDFVSLWYYSFYEYTDSSHKDSGVDVLVKAKRSDQTPWLGDDQFAEGDKVFLALDEQYAEYYIIAGPAVDPS